MIWQNCLMYFIGGCFIFLAIRKKLEPALLLPLGFGTILVNLPDSPSDSIINWLFDVGIEQSEAMPFLLFIGIGAMIDFSPLLENPLLALFGLFSQIGIFIVFKIALLLGFPINDAASIGIIGAADGPTAILVSRKLNSAYSGQITLAAYSYIALVPLILPFVAKILTTKKERNLLGEVNSEIKLNKHSKIVKIIFPIAVTFISGLIAPQSAQLTGFLMFGNLLRECGVLDRLADSARTILVDLITILLGLTLSFTMKASDLIQPKTLFVISLGLLAFVFDISGGIIFAKLLNLFKKKKLNPLIAAAGISAFPVSSHVVQKIASEENSSNIILMQAVAANVSGQIFSAIIGGVIISCCQ